MLILRIRKFGGGPLSMSVILIFLCSIQAVKSADTNCFAEHSPINILALQSDGKVLLGGGSFTYINGSPRFLLARLNPDGSVDTGFNLVPGVNSVALALQSDGKVLVGGGHYTYINGNVRRFLMTRLNPDGSVDTGFNLVPGANYRVYALAVQSDGKMLLGGTFPSINGIPRSGIARLNTDGTVDTSFDPGTGANSGVMTLAVQSDGKVLLGGGFTQINGITRNRIARLNADGSVDTSFDPGTGANNGVMTLAVQSDGKVLLGGYFTRINGIPRSGIARLNADGSVDTSFDPGTGANNAVMALAVQSDSKVLLGGYFTRINGIPRFRIARLNTDGSVDTNFDPGAATESWGVYNTRVLTLALQSDGKVLVGGLFTRINGILRNCIARLNPDGSVDTSFIPPVDADDFLLMALPAIIAANNAVAGTYTGTMRYTVITSPGSSVSGSGFIEIRVNKDRTIVVYPSPGSTYPGSGTISGNSATLLYPAQNFNSPGVSCSGTVKGQGTFSGNTINGTLGPSAFTCNGNALSITGTFTSTKNN